MELNLKKVPETPGVYKFFNNSESNNLPLLFNNNNSGLYNCFIKSRFSSEFFLGFFLIFFICSSKISSGLTVAYIKEYVNNLFIEL